MTKKLISLLLSNALVLFVCSSTPAAGFQGTKEAKETAEVKARIAKLGTATRVEIRLRDKTKLKGYLQQIEADHFVISDLKTPAVTKVAYAQVQDVKQVREYHLSDRKLSGIALGILTALFIWANSTDRP